MPITFRIALRNLREHQAKSIIIIGLIALGMFLLVLGNSVIDTGKVGIEKSFIDNFSGHLIVGPLTRSGEVVSMFGSGAPGMGEAKTVPEYGEVYAYLRSVEGITALNPQVYGAFQIEISEEWRSFAGFFGVDVASYQTMFPDNIEVVQGRFLDNSDRGFVLPEKTWQNIKEKTGIALPLGETLTLSGFGQGVSAMQLPLIGTFRFRTGNSSVDDMAFMDLSSLRYLQGMVVGSTDQIEIAEEATSLLGSDEIDFDALFAEPEAESELVIESAAFDQENLLGFLGDTSQRAQFNQPNNGAWSYILVRLGPADQLERVMGDLNATFAEKGWEVRAADWEKAAGPVATFVRGAQLFFLILVIILSVVSMIIIMNTMVVSIYERTAEIGTMRALGAHKSYIREIFLAETMTLSVLGGLVGLTLAGILIAIFHQVGLPSPNPIFDIVFGGKVLYPVVSMQSVVTAGIIMFLVGFLSSLYPTAMALRISPLKAMSS